MEENKNIIENQSEESSIDFVAIWKAILKHRKLYYKVLPVTFIFMCIYTLSLPNYYKCVVTLAPEMGGKGGSGSGRWVRAVVVVAWPLLPAALV